jgi:uncharacterized membrane protein
MPGMRNSVRRFYADRAGNIAIFSAVIMVVVMGAAALGVDVGNMFVDRRKAQSTTDIAAMVAASNPTSATAAVAATIANNNFNATAPAAIQYGIYTANAALPVAQRFVTSSVAAANAVGVTLQTSTPLFFGKVLTGSDSFAIQTTAMATTTGFATFEIGSTLLSVNGGLVNSVLGQMLGSSLSLSVMSYQSLLSANIDMFGFMNALATRMNVTGVSYTSLLGGSASVGTILNAMIDSEQASSGTSAVVSALSQIATAVNGATSKLPLSSLVNPGPYGTMTVGQTPGTGASVSLYNLVAATASLANGTNQVASSLDVNLPGLLSVTMMLAIGQPPVGTSWVTVGSVGASVYTAQTRLLLTIQIGGSGQIASVDLPIYVNIANASATLTALQCGYPNISTSTVTLGVTPGVVDSWIGNVTPSMFTNMSSPVNPGPATLVSAPLLTITGLAHVAMNNMSATPVTFTYADIQAMTMKTVNTTNYTQSLTTQLLDSLSLNVSVGGLGLGLPSLLDQAVINIISPETATIDQLLASVLQTVGVAIGQANVWVTGLRCDGAVLVN